MFMTFNAKIVIIEFFFTFTLCVDSALRSTTNAGNRSRTRWESAERTASPIMRFTLVLSWRGGKFVDSLVATESGYPQTVSFGLIDHLYLLYYKSYRYHISHITSTWRAVYFKISSVSQFPTVQFMVKKNITKQILMDYKEGERKFMLPKECGTIYTMRYITHSARLASLITCYK